MTTTQATARETSELSPVDQLVEIDDRTNEDGTVDVTIEDWTHLPKDGGAFDKVEVEFSLIDTTQTEEMRWPQIGHDIGGYKFTQLVRSNGLSMRNADLLKGKDAKAQLDNEWTLVTPEDGPSRGERAVSAAQAVFGELATVPWVRLFYAVVWFSVLMALMIAVIA